MARYRWQTMSMPFAAGVNTKPDPRALNAPGLAVARDVQFDELGGLQTRKPFASVGTNILGGGTLSNARRVVANGDELLCFTSTALYSWSASDSAWVLKGTYLAPKLEEKAVFASTAEQVQVDRVELNNVIVYTWVDKQGSTTGVKAAALDKTTGAVLLAPTGVGSSAVRPRLVALTSVIHLYFLETTTLKAIAITPTSLASSVAATPTSIGTSCNDYYDVVAGSNQAYVAYRRSTTTSYEVKLVTAALSVTSSTKARTCDGPIAVSYEANTSRVQIVRANSTNIQGDLLNASTLADVFTAQAIGTVTDVPVNQIAACHRSVIDGSAYRCYAYWSSEEASNDDPFACKTNWVDTGNTLGTQSTFILRHGVASRAFDHGGRIYVWVAFAGESEVAGMVETSGFRAQLQNTYFLFRDDGHRVGKAVATKAGGFGNAIGHLAGVQSLGSNAYAWCGIERQVIALGGDHSGYGARSPRDVVVTFDSDEARRCARLGETLYVTGAELLQYDGEGLTEVGFNIYPWFFTVADSGAGTKEAGTRTYKATYRWNNAKNEIDRSTTASNETITSLASRVLTTQTASLHTTHKTSSRAAVAVEFWCTTDSPTSDAPFYLITSKDPSDVTNPNRYISNSPTSNYTSGLNDELTDAELIKLELFHENGGILEHLCPPGASIIAATHERLFLAGIPGAPHQIWYSRLREIGEVASFHDTLTVDLPPEGGPITALAFLDETLVVFKETAVFLLPGDGFDNAGGGQNYGPARRVSADVGAVSAEAVAFTPAGLIFKSNKGWYMLGRSGSVQYIGDRVAAFDSDTVKAVNVVEAQHQVRCLTGSRMLVWDYHVNEWSEWTITDGLGACIWNGTHVYCYSAGAKAEQASYSGLTYGLDVETAWIKLADLQGFGALRWLEVLGEHRSAHALRVRVAYNYKESDASGPTWVDDKSFTSTPATVGGPLQFLHGPKQHRIEAVKFRFTAHTAGDNTTPPTGEALKLTGLSLELGFEPGLFRRLPAAQKQ